MESCNNTTDIIKKAISDTADRLNNNSIITVEDMIPHMNTIIKKEDYPKDNILDKQYGESEDAKMDIYYPESGEGPYPVFIEVHGGAWFFGQKSSIEFKPFLYGLKRGYVCISLGYTLAPKSVYPQAVLEIKHAIAYIKDNAEKLKINPDKIAIWGGSAGAQLAALAAFSEGTGYLSINRDLSINTLILWYGCYNFHTKRTLDDWTYENYFGVNNIMDACEQIILSNPAHHITKNIPNVFLTHGVNDVVVPYEQSLYLYNAIKDIAGEEKCKLELAQGCDHADIKLFAEENIIKLFDYIDSKMFT